MERKLPQRLAGFLIVLAAPLAGAQTVVPGVGVIPPAYPQPIYPYGAYVPGMVVPGGAVVPGVMPPINVTAGAQGSAQDAADAKAKEQRDIEAALAAQKAKDASAEADGTARTAQSMGAMMDALGVHPPVAGQ